MKPVSNVRLSVAEYIQYEIDTNQKYEYHNGEIFALAGGTIEHALLVGNIYSELRNGLKAKNSNCKLLQVRQSYISKKRINMYILIQW